MLSWIRQGASCFPWAGLAPPHRSPSLLKWCNFALAPAHRDSRHFTAPHPIQCSISGVWPCCASHRSAWFVASIRKGLSIGWIYDLAVLFVLHWVYKPALIQLTFVEFIHSLTVRVCLPGKRGRMHKRTCYSGKCCSCTSENWCAGDINKVYLQIFCSWRQVKDMTTHWRLYTRCIDSSLTAAEKLLKVKNRNTGDENKSCEWETN